jgi:tetratricopeptide (TPR) repeat protein
MKNRYLYIYLFGTITVFTGSCGKKADLQSVRMFVNAQELYSNGRFSQVTELLNSEKRFPPSLTLRAKAEYFMNNLDKAETSCRQALKYRPTAYEAKYYLARILREKGEKDKAKELIENLLADNPQDIQVLRFAANNALDQGDFAQAISLLNQAAQLSSESAMVLLDRARLRWATDRKDEALDDLSRAKAMLPWDSPIAGPIGRLEEQIMGIKQ